MTTEDRRQREREQRRQQILRSARDIILEQGYDQTSMQEIADHAELSKGTLYLYFDNKDALFLAINKFVLEEIRDKFREVMKHDRDGFWLVEHLGTALIECIQAHPEYLEALTLYDAKVDDQLFNDHPCQEEYESIVQELLMTWTRALQIRHAGWQHSLGDQAPRTGHPAGIRHSRYSSGQAVLGWNRP